MVLRLILGLPLAAAFAVLNAMWYELMEATPSRRPAPADRPDRQPLLPRADPRQGRPGPAPGAARGHSESWF